MSFFGKLTDIVTGGLGKEIVGAIKEYFPPDMPPEKLAQIELAAKDLEIRKLKEVGEIQSKAEQVLNDRIAMYEGTASDLNSLPFFGNIMLFLRGAQRPIWGFSTIILDYYVFSGQWKLVDPQAASAFWVINFLVLGFLFGERAITNVMPLLVDLLNARKGGK